MRPVAVNEDEVRQKLQPVILGADFCGYAYIRCFWEAYRVRPIMLGAFDVKSVSRSRFVDYRVVPNLDRPEIMLDTLRLLGNQLIDTGKIPFLVGCGDHYARLVSENKHELEQQYYVPYIDFELLDQITQKENFYKICDEIGIPYPKTVFLDCSDPNAAVEDGGFDYPLIAKPSNSAAYHYADIHDKKKVYLVRSHDELERIFHEFQLSNYKHSLIIQEFVPGDDTQIRILSMYADRNSDPVFMCGGRVILEDHEPSAIGNPAIIVPERAEQVFQDAAKFMHHVRYHGMANFDVKYDCRDGSFRFFEINTRPGRSSFFTWQAGVNFAKVQVDDILLNKKMKFVSTDRPFVYTTVPPYVAKRSISDPLLRDQVLSAFKDGTARFPLHWEEECLAQKFWSSITYYHQIAKFNKYFWGPNAKSLA